MRPSRKKSSEIESALSPALMCRAAATRPETSSALRPTSTWPDVTPSTLSQCSLVATMFCTDSGFEPGAAGFGLRPRWRSMRPSS